MRVSYSGLAASRAIEPPFLRRRFLIIDEGDDNGAVFGRLAALDEDRVAIHDAGFDHRITLDLKREMLARADHAGREGEAVGLMLDGGDGYAGSDPAEHRHINGAIAVGGFRFGEIAAHDIRAEIALGDGRRFGDGR